MGPLTRAAAEKKNADADEVVKMFPLNSSNFLFLLDIKRWEHLVYQMGDNDQTIDKVVKRGRIITF